VTAACPHDCVRCRAIEAGLAGRPLTHAEFLSLYEIKTRPPREVVWADDTAEAALSLELAETAWQKAHRTHHDVLVALERETKQTRRRSELIEAAQFARRELDDADGKVVALRVRHRELVERDLQGRREEDERVELAAAERTSADAETTRRRAGRSLIRRLQGPPN
jgi:hypothetical protein